MKAKILLGVALIMVFAQLALAESPSNGSFISDSAPEFSWDISDTDQINYTLRIDNNEDLASPVFTQDDIEETNYSLSSGDLDGEGTYYWQANGTAENDTSIYNFTLDTTPPQPGQVTIDKNYTNSSEINIGWSGFTDNYEIKNYYVNYSDDSGTTDGINVTGTSVQLNNSDEGNISIYVWAEDIAGNIGNAESDWIVADYTPPEFNNWNTDPDTLAYSISQDLTISFSLDEEILKTTPECRYKIGENADYNSWQETASSGDNNYSYSISEDWEEHAGETLYYQCNATDMVGHKNITNRQKDIVENDAPQFVKAEDQQAVEDVNISFVIEANDGDGDSLSFSSDHDEVIISNKNSTAAYVSWIPDNLDVGDNIINFTAYDGYNSTTTSINIHVNGTNDRPVLEDIENIEGYLHEPIQAFFYATDPDNQNSATSDDQTDALFTADKDWFEAGDEIKSGINFTNDGRIEYVGRLNFTPLLSHKGKHNVTIEVTDQDGLSDKESFMLDIGYCGDTDAAGQPKCDSDYENCETCPEDCGKCSVQSSDAMALLTPDRNCLYTNVTVSAYKLYERATCDNQGEIINGKEICEPIDGATIILYELVNDEWKKKEELVTSKNGKVSFIPEEAGDYKLVGKFKSYRNANKFVEFRKCIDVQRNESNNNTNQSSENKEKENNGQNNNQNNEQNNQPKEEQPGEVQEPGEKIEKASLVETLLYYVIIPVLFAILIFVLFIYYEKEKNRNPQLLKFRIWLLKKKKMLAGELAKYWQKVKAKTGY